ncbi:hypothetical protein, partial [Acidovorax sp. CF316]|uniref:hypothetical protein n=1 Tax=Acidovorax sp. CF316 TaxID=1144317 RepID=UPI001EE64BDD
LRLLAGLFNAHQQVLEEWGIGAKALTNSFCDAAIEMAVVQNISCPSAELMSTGFIVLGKSIHAPLSLVTQGLRPSIA